MKKVFKLDESGLRELRGEDGTWRLHSWTAFRT